MINNHRFVRIYKKYFAMIYRICIVRLRCSDMAYDAVQDVFLKYMEKSDSFITEEHTKAWLIRAAINQCNNILNNKWNRDKVTIADDYIHELYTNEEDVGRYVEVQDALSSLSTEQQMICYLHIFEGYSLKDIAKIIGVNYSTLRNKYCEIKVSLRD